MTPQDVANAKRDRMSKKRFAFPYGETWINNKATAEQTSTPYKFTAKEYDEETGLYYYGARYYDAKLSRWVSADPPLARGDYLPVPPIDYEAMQHNDNLLGQGGIFNPINLNAYTFCAENPVKYIDANGNAWDIVDIGFCVWSWTDFREDPGWGNFGWAVVDTAALLPILPSSGYIRRPMQGAKAGIRLNRERKVFSTLNKLYGATKKLQIHHWIPQIFAKGGNKWAKHKLLQEAEQRGINIVTDAFNKMEIPQSMSLF